MQEKLEKEEVFDNNWYTMRLSRYMFASRHRTLFCLSHHHTGSCNNKKKKNWTNLCIPLQITQQTIKHEKVLSGKQNPVMHFHGSKLFGVL